MSLSTEEIQTILDGAPDGATHVEIVEDDLNEYWMLDSDECLWHWHKNPKDPNRTWRIGIPELPVENIQSLENLREILTLRQEVERLKAELELYRDVAKRFNEEQGDERLQRSER